jgi:hypothetical protein
MARKEIKTKAGSVWVEENPLIDLRTKEWAERLIDVVRVDELYALIQEIRDEAKDEVNETYF